jgi:hypothetical protein
MLKGLANDPNVHIRLFNIDLVPKKPNPSRMGDFRPIACSLQCGLQMYHKDFG